MTWGRSVLIAIDQLFNALAGGNPDETISARLGYLDYIRKTWLARPLRILVDVTFYPLDGWGHCHNAYYYSMPEIYVSDFTDGIPTKYIRGNNAALIALSIFVVAGCIILTPITYFIWICRELFVG